MEILSVQGRLNALNCAGQGCPERGRCRRFVVRVNVPHCSREQPYGAWGSFDLERAWFGECASFVKYRES